MALGWLSVLQMVPWGDVISNAPKVADSAKKLWQVVGRNHPTPDVDVIEVKSEISAEAQAIKLLQVQLASAEAEISELHVQMLASSELIKTLADQNTQLIQRVEVNRIRLLWLSGATVVLAVAVTVNMILTITR